MLKRKLQGIAVSVALIAIMAIGFGGTFVADGVGSPPDDPRHCVITSTGMECQSGCSGSQLCCGTPADWIA